MIAIKNMKMPKSCCDCPFKWTDSESVDVCSLLETLGKNYEANLGHQTVYDDFKSKACPLIEVEVNNMEEKLKRCPVLGCNGKGKIEHNAWDGLWWVECSKCHKMGPIVYCNRQQAIDAWNKRS